MIAVELFGAGAAALLAILFCFVRRLRPLVACGLAVVGSVAVITYPERAEQLSAWLLVTAGLVATWVGLSILRLMLIRSVSLHLLGQIDGSEVHAFQHGIRGRLHDMRAGRLIRSMDGRNALTGAGRAIAAVVAALYAVLSID